MNTPQWTDRRSANIVLGCMVEPGSRQLGDLVAAAGPDGALSILLAGGGDNPLQDAFTNRLGSRDPRRVAELALTEAERLGARIVTPDDDEWPIQLNDLRRLRTPSRERVRRDTMPPMCLWVRGSWRLDEALRRSVAMVGARASTHYGQSVAGEIAYGLAGKGWTVVSGGAFGIDAAAHRGAMAGRGLTFSVLACGVDRPYPLSHASLFDQIAERGALISEWPPGSSPYAHRFLVRNRVIAAMTIGTLVVEAAARSGSLQTLRLARELGRIQMAVPGPVTSAMSVGCHEVLRMEETRLVASWEHVLEEVGRIGLDLAPEARGPERATDRLDEIARQVRDALPPRGSAGPDQIATAAGVPLRIALRVLGLLVSAGHAVHRDGGYGLPEARSSTMTEPPE